MHRFLRPSMAIMAVVACAGAPALAVTTTPQNMTVTAKVTPSCSLDSVATMELDNLTLTTKDADATKSGNINVTCTNGTGYDIVIADSDTAVGTVRYLTSADKASTLAYDFYMADGVTPYPTTASTTPSTFTGSGASQSQQVIMKLAAGQLGLAKAATYTDTVAVTVAY